jgi:hypothetical protein
METLVLTAEQETIEGARRAAAAENWTLEEVVRELLARYAAGAERGRRFDAVVEKMKQSGFMSGTS